MTPDPKSAPLPFTGVVEWNSVQFLANAAERYDIKAEAALVKALTDARCLGCGVALEVEDGGAYVRIKSPRTAMLTVSEDRASFRCVKCAGSGG